MSRPALPSPCKIIALVGLVAGVLIAGIVLYTATVEHSRDYAVLKAVGAGAGVVYGSALLQSVVPSLFGVILGWGLAAALAGAFDASDPVVESRLDLDLVMEVSVAILAANILAALLPVGDVSDIDPHPLASPNWAPSSTMPGAQRGAAPRSALPHKRVEERSISAQGQAQRLGVRRFARAPAKPLPQSRVAVGHPLHQLADQHLGLLGGRGRVVDEPSLEDVPALAIAFHVADREQLERFFDDVRARAAWRGSGTGTVMFGRRGDLLTRSGAHYGSFLFTHHVAIRRVHDGCRWFGLHRLGLRRLGLRRLGLHRLGLHRLGLHRLVTHGTVAGAPPLVVEFVGAVSWLLHHLDSFWAAGREVSASVGTRPLDLSAPGSGRLACWSCSPRSLSKRSR